MHRLPPSRRRRVAWTCTATVLAVGLLAVSCGGGAQADPAASVHRPVSLVLWVAGGPRARTAYRAAVAGFRVTHPWITVRVDPAPATAGLVAAVAGDRTADALAGPLGGAIAPLCATGVLQDLTAMARRSGLTASTFPRATAGFTGYGGLACGLPVTTSARVLVIDASMTAQIGLTRPPQTWAQLASEALALTLRRPDGSIAQAGFIPWQGYQGFQIGEVAVLSGGHWFDPSGHADLAAQPAWLRAFRWQRRLLGELGLGSVERFVAEPGDALAGGRLAIAAGAPGAVPAGVPAGRFAVAAAPVGGAVRLGVGAVSGDVLAIPRGAPNAGPAWTLIRYLATDPPAQQRLAAALGQLPAARAALRRVWLAGPQSRRVEVNAVTAPGSFAEPPVTLAGTSYAALLAQFDDAWQRGDIPSADLPAALAALDRRIDARIALVTRSP